MTDMTISQALRRVKKLKGQLAEHLARATSSVTYRDNHKPAFAFSYCIEKAADVRSELLELMGKLAETNSGTVFTFDGQSMTLASAIHFLQELKGQIAWYRTLSVRDHSEETQEEQTYDDEGKRVRVTTRWFCALPEAKRAVIVDDLQNKFDRLNDVVEKINHSTLLVG